MGLARKFDITSAAVSYAIQQGEKMASSKEGPFFHLMPLTGYKNKVYFTLGMGAGHYIFLSGKYLLWFQTYQSFGRLPPQLLKFYPA